MGKKAVSLFLAVAMLLSFGAGMSFAAQPGGGYDYADIAAGRVIKPFTLVGSFENNRINNYTLAAGCSAYLWDGAAKKFMPAAVSSATIVGNFAELRNTAAGSTVNLILAVASEDSEGYWDSGMAWDFDLCGGDDEWRIPYGERLIKEYGIGGAADDYSNIVEYGALGDSTYWPLHDYYGAASGGTLTMLSGFKTSQQSTGWACGLTSALMVIDWFGLRGDLNEQDLAALRKSSSQGGATNLQQLINVFNGLNALSDLGKGEWGKWEIYSSYDVVAENSISKPAGGKYSLMSVEDLMDGTTIRGFLEKGIPVMIGWNSFGGHWQVIIGYDDMGSDDTKDHVLILADPYDTTDHLNDGYNIQSLERLVYDWSAGFDPDFKHGIFVAAAPVGWDYDPAAGGGGIPEYKAGYDGDATDAMKLDYGRTAADIERYYPSTPWRGDNGLAGAATGGYERVPNDYVNVSPYYAHYDYFNWKSGLSPASGGELIMLENFKTEQQATEWTCGLTSALMAIEWYGANPGMDKLTAGYANRDSLDARLTEINLAQLRGEGRKEPGATTLDDLKRVFDSLNADDGYLSALAAKNGWKTLHKWEYITTDNLTRGYVTGKDGVRHYLEEGAADGGIIPYYLGMGCPVLIGWDEWGGHWQVVIGYDDMGTEATQDDVIILADPYDTTDHNQDGYYLEAFERLVFGWGAAFDSRRSNVFMIPYLVDTGVAAGTSVKLATAAHNVKAGDYFTLNTSFAARQDSNAAILTYAFDGAKFEYAGFTPAAGVQVMNAEHGAGYAKITVISMDYDLKSFGEIMLWAKEDAAILRERQTVSVSADYVLLKDGGGKEILAATGSATFTTLGGAGGGPAIPGDTNSDGVLDLIDLSNMIDWFGAVESDPGWDDLYIFFDFNTNGVIDISDIAYVARLIA